MSDKVEKRFESDTYIHYNFLHDMQMGQSSIPKRLSTAGYMNFGEGTKNAFPHSWNFSYTERLHCKFSNNNLNHKSDSRNLDNIFNSSSSFTHVTNPLWVFSLLSDFLPFHPFLTQLSAPSHFHPLYILFDVLNPTFPWSSSVSPTCWFPNIFNYLHLIISTIAQSV